MLWEEITSCELERAVRESGVCLLPISCLERHSDHLPLGTDMFTAYELSKQAAEIEPAVVFPHYYFGQIYEARCFPGTITIPPVLLIELLSHVVDEIGRNGFKKIILISGHGGNRHLLPFFCQCQLSERKDYQVYYFQRTKSPEQQAEIKNLRETNYGEHADEVETSMILALRPELVHMDRIAEPAPPLGRMKAHLEGCYNGLHWYADHPEHYSGDARTSTAEKGRRMIEIEVENLVRMIAAVKNDTMMPGLANEFYDRTDALGRPPVR